MILMRTLGALYIDIDSNTKSFLSQTFRRNSQMVPQKPLQLPAVATVAVKQTCSAVKLKASVSPS